MPQDLQGEFVINKNTLESEVVAPVAKPDPNSSNPAGTAATTSNNAHFFSNFSLYPQNVTFENQEENEQIVLLIRRDLITNLPWIIAALILIFIPFIIGLFSFVFTPFFNISTQTQLILTLFYYLIITGFVLVQFTLWYFSVGLVTTKRLIDLNVFGILYKQVSETKLNLVEDVSYSQIGSIRSVFDYGDVQVQTAAAVDNFEFDRVPNPARIVKIIADMIGGPR